MPWFQLPASDPPAQHPCKGHGCLAARLCGDQASYATDVGRCLEHRPDARTGATVTWVSTSMTSSSHHRTSATYCARSTSDPIAILWG